jgi:hypothetical protein
MTAAGRRSRPRLFRALTRGANFERISAASARNLQFLSGSQLRGMPAHREPAGALHRSSECPLSMDETHVCVLDREGVVVRESKAASTAEAIAGELAKAPSCRRIVFDTGRMAPILFHRLNQLGLPVVCVENRQAYQALNSLATHKTDLNDVRGLAPLARTGFFKPVHVRRGTLGSASTAFCATLVAGTFLISDRVRIRRRSRRTRPVDRHGLDHKPP